MRLPEVADLLTTLAKSRRGTVELIRRQTLEDPASYVVVFRPRGSDDLIELWRPRDWDALVSAASPGAPEQVRPVEPSEPGTPPPTGLPAEPSTPAG